MDILLLILSMVILKSNQESPTKQVKSLATTL